MKFRVVVNTHKKPHYAISCLTMAQSMESGLHEVGYTLAYDAEDILTDMEVTRTGSLLWNMVDRVDCQPKPQNINDIFNRNVPGKDDADFYVVFTDDGFCAAPAWDEFIAQRVPEYKGLPVVMGWNDQANPGQLTLPIVSRQWVEVSNRPLLDTVYPYWFSDTAINELYGFATGNYVPCFEYLLLVSKPGNPNPIIRDVDLWWDFYAFNRQERLEAGRSISRKLGIRVDEDRIQQMLSQHAERDALGRAATHEIFNTLEREPRKPPTDHYLKAVEYAKWILMGG